MTNIFNKKVIAKNGTLEKNWLEERSLRDISGEGRTIPGQHIPKKTMNFEKEEHFDIKRDNTKVRILGTNLETEFKNTNSTYGTFKNEHQKYQRMGVKDKIFQDFFNNNLYQSQKEKEEHETIKSNLRLLETTKNNELLPQNVDYSNLGRRIMKSQDNIQVQNEQIDKLFMASHDMSKYPNIISNNTANQYIDKTIPYYKDKEITFWSMNLEKSNFYRSHTQGINAFAKSSGITQNIHNSKSVKQFHGNVQNHPEAKFVYTNEFDEKFIKNFNENTNLKAQNADLMPTIREKIIAVCRKLGWLGLRKLRIFSRNLSGRKSHLIKRADFKYYLAEFGILLIDSEVAFIYQLFDDNRKDEINFMVLYDSLIDISEQRMKMIDSFASQLKNDSGRICFKTLQNLLKTDFHPEVVAFKKTYIDVMQDFINCWDNLKEDNIILLENFLRFFRDVSFSVENDNDFIQILKCW